MPKPWRFLPYDSGRVKDLCAQLKISPLLAQVLSARGFEEERPALAFLNSKLNELHDPELLPGVPLAADLIVAAMQAKRRITIYGDYDVDGVTATSLLWHCLKLAGATVDYYIPSRLEEGYGINSDAIRKLHAEDPQRLLVSVDCGICSVVEAALAKEIGLELIITDHHQFGDELPDALVLVHPRLPNTSYPFGDLCGAGVAFKLAWAICQRLGDGKKASPRMREFLISAVGLAAVGTVADVVPLLGENRILVRYGLTSLPEKASLGLKALMKIAGFEGKSELQAEDIAFGIAPRINAAGRLGQARLAVELLTTDVPERARTLAEYIDEQNKVRQTVERKVFKQAKELVEANPEWLNGAAMVLAHAEWHPGVIGIVASRVTEHFQKPAVMIAINQSEGIGQGSGRTFGSFDLHAGLTACREHLIGFGGHRAAAGMKIAAENIDLFRAAFCAHVTNNHAVLESDLEQRIDGEVRLSDLTLQAIVEMDRLGPFGRDNVRPVFACQGVELAEPPKKMGEGERHLSLMVRQGSRKIRGVSFGHGDWADEINAAVAGGGTISICFAPNINRYQGRENVEMHLIDWKADKP
ncbi:MAG: recJ [Planctomycetaceae bacterium]|nr:recJ [Planctomycetaceae bacterium]